MSAIGVVIEGYGGMREKDTKQQSKETRMLEEDVRRRKLFPKIRAHEDEGKCEHGRDRGEERPRWRGDRVMLFANTLAAGLCMINVVHTARNEKCVPDKSAHSFK